MEGSYEDLPKYDYDQDLYKYYAYGCAGKNIWPELVGQEGGVAAAKIMEENPGVRAVVIPHGAFDEDDSILEPRCDRVKVHVNQYGFVYSSPQVG